MKSGTIKTSAWCDDRDKIAPAFMHLAKEAHCVGIVLCDERRLAVAFSCPSAAGTRALKRSIDREVKLLRHHGLASRKRRR